MKVSVAVMAWGGPSNDKTQAWKLLERSFAQTKPPLLYADAGYDAEWIHGVCREDLGIGNTVIKPARCAADGTRRGEYRAQMSGQFLKRHHYGLRWKVETYISGLKRTTGSTLNSRNPRALLKEAAFKVLAYAFNR